MVNTYSMQFFLKSKKSEAAILDLLAAVTGFLVESLEVERENAPGFAQISVYSQGFEQGVLITWPREVTSQASSEEVVRSISVGLNVPILLEPIGQESDWLLAKPDGSLMLTKVNYLDDGIVAEIE